VTAEPLLRTQHLTGVFSGFVAVNNVNFVVAQGERRAIIGPNGAGKTTFFRLLSGDLPPSHGHIWLAGQEISRLPAYRRSRLGVGRSYQIASAFPTLSVFENLRIAAQPSTVDYQLWRTYRPDGALGGRVDEVVDFIGLGPRRRALASQLSYGDRRRLELGMALANEPRLLLLDEPTAGMTPSETDETVELIHRIAQGRTVILVEHKIKVVMTICDRVTAFHQGRILAEGTPAEIRANREVQAVYFGAR
jgi:branched-chain amino acid transport system ATP-binding protein